MPKFTTQEKDALSADLRSKGEAIFLDRGLKKTTVDSLTRSVGIAKGSFYAFYGSKEELYFDILTRCQQDMWQHMVIFLQQHKQLDPQELVKTTFIYLLSLMESYPLLSNTDAETVALLWKKLPHHLIEEHTQDDTAAIDIFCSFGVRFTEPTSVVAKTFQVLYSALTLLKEEEENLSQQVATIMVEAMVNELVEEHR